MHGSLNGFSWQLCLPQIHSIPIQRKKIMKKLTVLVLVLAGLSALSGCVAVPVPYDSGRPDHHPGANRGYGDRDGDGVRNRDDRRPNNPNRY
jgi:hypothetical protein